MEYWWPDFLKDPSGAYRPDLDPDTRYKAAVADQSAAWGNCMAGIKPPATFGEAMSRLGEISGALLPEEVSAAAKAILGQ